MYLPKTTKTLWAGLAFVMGISLSIQAADPNLYGSKDRYGSQKSMSQTQTSGMSMNLCSLDKLKGVDVKSSKSSGRSMDISTNRDISETRGRDISVTTRQGQQEEKIGTVEEVVLDNHKNAVAYIIVSAEGKYYPVPWSAFDTSHLSAMGKSHVTRTGMTERSYSAEDANTKDTGTWKHGSNYLMVNMGKSQFQQAPSIDSVDITQLSEASFKQKIDSFYSRTSTSGIGLGRSALSRSGDIQDATDSISRTGTSSMQQANLIKASDLKDSQINNTSDEDLAKVQDIIVDTKQGTLAYCLVSFGGVLGVGESFAAVPWSALKFQQDNKVATLDATTDQLKDATIDKDRLDQLSQQQFAQRIHQNFNTQPYWQVYGFTPGEEKMDSNEPNAWNKDKKNGTEKKGSQDSNY